MTWAPWLAVVLVIAVLIDQKRRLVQAATHLRRCLDRCVELENVRAYQAKEIDRLEGLVTEARHAGLLRNEQTNGKDAA